MTEPDLIAAGYRRYPGPGPWSNADRCYQRTIRSPDGRSKLYFINFGVWDFGKYDRFPKDQDPIRFEGETHFYQSSDRSFRVAIPVEEGDSVGDIERLYARFYEAMGCVPDIHNNDGE